MRIHRSFSETRTEDEARIGIIEATTETARYAAKDRRVLALISVKFGFGVAAGVLALIAIFAKEVYRGGDIAFGLLMAARGVGALIGPFLGHRLSGRNHERLLPAIALALAVFGVGYMCLGVTPTSVARDARGDRRAPRRRRAVDALELRPAAAGARSHPGADLLVRLRADHPVARHLEHPHGAARRRGRRSHRGGGRRGDRRGVGGSVVAAHQEGPAGAAVRRRRRGAGTVRRRRSRWPSSNG